MNQLTLFSTLFVLLFAQVALGQIPQTMSYQGLLTDADGKPVAAGQISLAFKLYDAATDGNMLWEETQQVDVAGGLFNVILGSSAPLNLPFDAAYWLGISVGGDSELEPRIELTAAAYSLNSRSITDNAVSTGNIQDGAVTGAKLADNAVTSAKIVSDEVVKSLNSLKDDIILAAGNNVTIQQNNHTLTISAAAGGAGDGHSLDAADGDPTDALFVDNDGNVGIGTTSPSSLLHIRGAQSAYATLPNYLGVFSGVSNDHSYIGVEAPAGFDSGYRFLEDSNVRWHLFNAAADSDKLKFLTGSFLNVMTLQSNGNVGIGTSSPGNRLEVVGFQNNDEVARFENTSTSNLANGIMIKIGPTSNPQISNYFLKFFDGDGDWVGWVSGDNAAGVNYNTASDARLKTNIADFAGGLDMVSRMKVRKYEFIEAPGKERIGFLAQELQTVFPQAVSGDPEGDVKENPMGVDYGRVTPVLVSAIQELIAKDKALQEENEALEERLERLEALLNVRQ